MELIRDLKKAMCAEYDDVKRDHVFTHIMAIAENDLKFSGKLVDSFICRQLITSKLHEKWFVFARTPLRFSLQEYHAVTGLKITRETNSDVVKWKNDGVFWSNLLHTGGKITLQSIRKVHLQEVHTWTRLDRMRLIYLCVIVGVVMGRDEKVSIPHMYIKLVMISIVCVDLTSLVVLYILCSVFCSYNPPSLLKNRAAAIVKQTQTQIQTQTQKHS